MAEITKATQNGVEYRPDITEGVDVKPTSEIQGKTSTQIEGDSNPSITVNKDFEPFIPTEDLPKPEGMEVNVNTGVVEFTFPDGDTSQATTTDQVLRGFKKQQGVA